MMKRFYCSEKKIYGVMKLQVRLLIESFFPGGPVPEENS